MRRIAQIGIMVVVANLLVSSLRGEGIDNAYLCVAEAAGGLAFDATTNKWSGVGFRADEKLVLRLTLIETKSDSYGTFSEYKVTITHLGSTTPSVCHPIADITKDRVPIYSVRRVMCQADLTNYTFDLARNSFCRSLQFRLLGEFWNPGKSSDSWWNVH